MEKHTLSSVHYTESILHCNRPDVKQFCGYRTKIRLPFPWLTSAIVRGRISWQHEICGRGGERWERRQWRKKRPERVAAVDEGRRCFNTEDIRRAPQQDKFAVNSINAGVVELADTLDLGSNG